MKHLQNEDTLSIYVLACMRVCVRAYLLALPSYGWDSVFSRALLLYLIFRSVVELHLRSVGTLL